MGSRNKSLYDDQRCTDAAKGSKIIIQAHQLVETFREFFAPSLVNDLVQFKDMLDSVSMA